jgi:DNA-binding MarR family transcriptional regulator
MLSRVVANLADAGLCQRATDPLDRRAAIVTATRAGRRLADKIRHERTEAINSALAPLTDRDKKLLEQALPALEALAAELKR